MKRAAAGSLQCWAGQGDSNADPSPRTPLPGSHTKHLTDADHFSMIETAQRRFAPTVIGILRNSDRHQIGIVIGFVGIRSWRRESPRCRVPADAQARPHSASWRVPHKARRTESNLRHMCPEKPRHLPGTGRPGGWCRERSSLPLAEKVREIRLYRFPNQSPSQFIEYNAVQALFPLCGLDSKGVVHFGRDPRIV